MKKLAVLTAIILALTCATVPPALAVDANPNVKIGLYSGTGALIAANLQNAQGSGYRFGFLGASGQFVQVALTGETKITMVKNRNVYLAGGTYQDESAAGAALVGCYHREIAKNLDSYESAVAQAGAAGDDAFVYYENGSWGVRAGSYASSEGKYVTGSKYAISVVLTGTNRIIFQFDMGKSTPLAISPDITGQDRPLTWFKGYRYPGVFLYHRADGNNLTVISYVSLQDYIKGVIPYEMSPSWPLQALKAQALCAKSYTMSNLSRHSSAGFDLCTETHCQVYRGANSANDTTNLAVDELEGVYLTYGGKICSTVYHSCDGGATEDSNNVWVSAVPYLKGVYDNYEDLSGVSSGVWQYTYTNDQLTQLLRDKGYTTSGVTDFYISKFTPTGNVYTVVLEDSSGKKFSFSKEAARTFFSSTKLGIAIHSQRYTINAGAAQMTVAGGNNERAAVSATSSMYAIGADGALSLLPASDAIRVISASGVSSLPTTAAPRNGVYVVSGRGRGHNVGMSQWGARSMAELGFTYDQIVKFYFQNIELTSGT